MNYVTFGYDIRREDIPESYSDVVEAIGQEKFLRLVRLCGGQSLYIPKIESLEREARDRDIRAHFDGGNYKQLTSQYRLSERQIQKIVNQGRGRVLRGGESA